MELEQPMFRETPKSRKLKPKTDHTKNMMKYSSETESSTSSSSDIDSPHVSSKLCHAGSGSFRTLEMGVPKVDSAEKKLSWLRSQIIGGDAEFDSVFGTRKLTYADHTASGRSLHYIENFILTNVLPFYGNTHTCDSYVGGRTTKMVHEACNYIKRCLGGGQDDAILFCGSGTTAAIKRLQEVMGITVPSILRDCVINCLTNEKRWVVFVGPYEHHSNLLSWRQSLAEVVQIGLDENGLIDIEALRLKLESYKYANRPLLGSFSACSNVTGIQTDTREIATLLHEYGGFVCFDFAASGPYVEIDMRSGEMDGYDAIFLSPHKFLGGPGSPGILLMSKALYQLGSSPPSTCGGGTVNYVNGFNEKDTLYVDDIEERENGGTPQIIQMIRAALAFWVKEYIGYQVIEKQEKSYIQRALDRLLPNQNICVLGNTSKDKERQAILSFLVYSTTNSSIDETEEKLENGLFMWGETGKKRDKPLHGPFVATLLNDLFGIQARGGCACAGPYGHSLLHIDETRSLAFREAIEKGYVGAKPGWTRVSFPYYMSNEEFEFILAALEFVAIYGQRFLPLYHFDLRTGSWIIRKKALKDLIGKENSHGNHVLPLATAFQAIRIDRDKSYQYNDAENGDASIIGKYASYLKSAKRIAAHLPKFPSERRFSENIDLDLLPFRV
ncbi:Aminotransferase, class V/Cysteine desulfurase [Corchorus capsularis]|uniref:Aminotransferase, class V/Cysteine desulfurase n=1 Tax=Corchorus capsularis TaxID=210143 RepID=A0A1R3GGE4_COCAP|nr:Aminotransferase, class V/Cysteine desulfurase [Corchorus capsularis]